MDCLFQTSLACTAHRQTESFSGWVLSDNLPGCSLEKIIRHTELEFVKSFYFILSMHSVLVQQSSGWISTPIKIPYFQEFVSCPWKEREQAMTARAGLPGWRHLHKILKSAQNQNDKCLLSKANNGAGWLSGCRRWALGRSRCLTESVWPSVQAPACLRPIVPRLCLHGQEKGPLAFQRASGLQGDTNAWTACLLWSLLWRMMYST